MKIMRSVAAFICGPIGCASAFYLSGAPFERGPGMCVAFVFSIVIGALFMLIVKEVRD